MQRLKEFYIRAGVWIRGSMLLGSILAGIFGIGWWASSVHHRLMKIEGRIVILDAKMDKLLHQNGIKIVERSP